MKRYIIAALTCAAWAGLPTPARGQGATAAVRPNGRIAVFLDCHSHVCDFDYLRRTIPVVNWVRDRRDADVHVLVTSERTGGGGTQHTISFIGLNGFEGREYTIEFNTLADDTFEEDRAAFAPVLQLGLGPYIAETDVARRATIDYGLASEAAPALAPQPDPWDFWVFNLSVNGGMNGESQERFWRGNGSVSADRVTEAFKISLRARASGHRSEYDVRDTTVSPILDTTYVSTQEAYSFDALAAWSLSPHWSAGVLTEIDRSSTVNLDFRAQGGPAIEYNVFPYVQSTRRILTLRYVLGASAANYTDTTIFFETAEVRPAHVFEVDFEMTEPWGGIRAGLDAFQYLHDLSKHSIGVGGGFNIRLVRGLNFNLNGNVSRIKDQLYLAKEDLTPEEVLLQQRARGTDFRFGANMGLSFRFGSKFNNVVNPRMR